MSSPQISILADVPRLARYLHFTLSDINQVKHALHALNQVISTNNCVIGLGEPLLKALSKSINGLRTFPADSAPGFSIPSTQNALWIWLKGDDRGELLHQSRLLAKTLDSAFALSRSIDTFQYRDSRDLTGYEDGTENPSGEDANKAAFVQNQIEGITGSSFVAVQQWVHNFDHFEGMPKTDQDNTIGRRISDNEEIDDAPDSAHVKRTAQEDFSPEAFILRRSMPWADEKQAGLVFVAFGHSFDAFEALLNRMMGKDDGIVDALFTFTRPISGDYFWCPPLKKDRLDFSAIFNE